MKYGLKDDSVRVINGELYSPDGKLIYDPCILVMGDVLLKAGNYDDMHKSLLSLYCELIDKGLSTDDIFLVSFNDFIDANLPVTDVCYIIRRGVEFSGLDFIKKLMEMRLSVDFLEWLEKEKDYIPIQVEEQQNLDIENYLFR